MALPGTPQQEGLLGPRHPGCTAPTGRTPAPGPCGCSFIRLSTNVEYVLSPVLSLKNLVVTNPLGAPALAERQPRSGTHLSSPDCPGRVLTGAGMARDTGGPQSPPSLILLTSE